jgi:hypothetical protein
MKQIDRRVWLTAAGRVAVGAAASLMLPNAHAQPSFKVSAEQLEKAIAQRFPRRYPAGGLFDINVQAPQLRLLPELNRLGAQMVVDAGGPALRRSYTGAFDLDFALRYEAADQSIRASQLRVNSLRFDDLPPRPAALLDAYGPTLAEQTLQDAVLHQLQPKDLALADTMGLEPGNITVTRQGLVINFVTKQPR